MTGELLAFLSAVGFALANVSLAKSPQRANVHAGVLLSALMTGLLSALALGISGVAGESPGNKQFAWHAIGLFVVSGLLSTVAGRLTLFKSIEWAGVVRAAATRRLLPLFSLLVAWVFLAEMISAYAGIGMLLILVSFVLLYIDNRGGLARKDDTASQDTIAKGLLFGVISAGLYAFAAVFRKLGLVELPDAYFGALIGSLVAVVWYFLAAIYNPEMKTLITGALVRPNPWQLSAALFISVGQLLHFLALTHAGVAKVAFINSLEVYFSAILAVWVFRIEPIPSPAVMVAILIATIGVAFIAFG